MIPFHVSFLFSLCFSLHRSAFAGTADDVDHCALLTDRMVKIAFYTVFSERSSFIVSIYNDSDDDDGDDAMIITVNSGTAKRDSQFFSRRHSKRPVHKIYYVY